MNVIPNIFVVFFVTFRFVFQYTKREEISI